MLGIKQSILNVVPKSYASSEGCPNGILPCSLGVNPYGIPGRVMDSLREIEVSIVNLYPHNNELFIAGIINKFKDVAYLSAENIVLGNGSIELLFDMNRMFLDDNRCAMGYLPQFPAYVDDVRYIGSKYEPYLLDKTKNYRFDVGSFLDKLSEVLPSLICLENPNNPTGQIIPLCDVEKIVAAAEKRNIFVLVDEAYGEYMPNSNSAVALIACYRNVAVTRSFSKGYGLGGMRVGYLIGPAELTASIRKISSPFDGNSIGRLLAVKILEEEDFCEKLMKKVQTDKLRVIESLKVLKVASTASTVPIMVLYCEDDDIDLRQVLFDARIDTVCGLSFDNLSRNCVRLMLCDDIPVLIERLQKAEKTILAGVQRN
jgi:histidinol-phosphate aminotransferase